MPDGRCRKATPYALYKIYWMEKIGHKIVYLEKKWEQLHDFSICRDKLYLIGSFEFKFPN